MPKEQKERRVKKKKVGKTGRKGTVTLESIAKSMGGRVVRPVAIFPGATLATFDKELKKRSSVKRAKKRSI